MRRLSSDYRAGVSRVTRYVAFRNRGAQFRESDAQLFGCAAVIVAVKAGKFQKDIEASNEGPARSKFWIRLHCAPQEAKVGLLP